MPDNFTAENVDSAGQVFATDQNAGNSVHYPIGKIAWGALNTFNITDTANPFPAQLFGNGLSSSAPVFAVNNSAHFLWAKPVTDTANPVVVRGVGSSVVPVANSSATPLFVRGVESSSVPVANSSSAPLFVRGAGDSTLPVSGTVTVNNDSSGPFYVTTDSGTSPVFRHHSGSGALADGLSNTQQTTRDLAGNNIVGLSFGYFFNGTGWDRARGSSAGGMLVNLGSNNDVTVSGSSTTQIGTVTNPAADSLGLTPFTASISSVATTVKNTVGRLYGWYISNPSSGGAYLKFYPEDSAGVTLGTSSAVLDMWIPPEGAANMALPAGISMSSGISVAAAGGAGSTNHASPPANLTVSLWYA